MAHPVWWGLVSGTALVLLGFVLGLAPIVVMGAGAAVGLLNVVHARKRGYCPLPAQTRSRPMGSQTQESRTHRRVRSRPEVRRRGT
ncbi:hypothetical protein ISU10_16040 [Nocardioides agariphilus]|uniref:DUF2892 domain-containing protein n=1 Tax=Nocardioides agariphilus TaxID=433664 RepID=A0A930VM54_9ACTN|nr:hypothetical protein [Nocardioides agariphilus]MBF4769278.1 hypothetical protein [Nocardioides agariphilus]